jgi:TrmH family RNA methyltransferase
MITSSSNNKVKFVRRLQSERRFRRREKLFVAEGERWLRDVIAQNVSPAMLFCTVEWQEKPENAAYLSQVAAQSGLTPVPVSADVLQAMSDIESPPGVLLVLPWSPPPLPPRPDLLLVLDNIRTPGNLGTMLRTAAAAGVDGVLLSPGCVDPTNPKVVRGGMGAQLRLPIKIAKWAEIGEILAPLQVWAATLDGEAVYTAVDWTAKSALIIGSEAHGAGPQARALADGAVTIPMAAATESLNAAIAAGVLLFEAARQRRQQKYAL